MDSTKFESIVGKYLVEGGIRVNKIVIVTHHGYYRPVVERARKLDIDLLTLEEAKQIDWSQFRPPGPSFKCRLEIRNVRLVPDVQPTEQVLRDGRVACSCGRYYGTVQMLAQFLFWEVAVRQRAGELVKIDQEAASKQEEKKANVKISGISGDHQRYLIFSGQRYPLEEISYDVCFRKCAQGEKKSLASVHFLHAPHVCRVDLIPAIPDADANEVAKTGRVVCSCCGKDYGSVRAWVHDRTSSFLPSNPEAQRLLAEGVSESPTGHAYLAFGLPFCKRLRVMFKGEEHRVQEIKVQIHAAAGMAPIECKQYKLTLADGQVKLVSHMEATVAGKQLTILMPEGRQSKRACVRIDNAELKTK